MATSIKITGGAKLRRKLAQATPLAITALAAAEVEEMERVMAQAKARTPVDTGTLRASGTVFPPEIRPQSVKTVAGFGGAAKDYAIVQHERLDFSHTVGEAKFLERPFLERAPAMPKALALATDRALRRLGH